MYTWRGGGGRTSSAPCFIEGLWLYLLRIKQCDTDPQNEWLHILIGAVIWRRAQGLDTRDKAEQKAQIWGHQLTAWSSFYVTA